MKRSIYNHSPRDVASVLWGLAFLLAASVGCTSELTSEADSLTADNDNQEAIIKIGEDATRGAYVSGPYLTKYAIYGFYNDKKTLYLNNSILTRDKPGDAWKKSKAVQYPSATRAVDFYAMAPGFTGGLVTRSKIQQTEKYITLTMPTSNPLQTDYMFSSIMAQTRQATNNVVKFNFKHIFCYLRFTSKLSNADIDVTIHSIKLHNLKSTGTFTMDDNKANTGSWTLDNDAYADYEFILPRDSALTYKKTVTLHQADSLLFVMPQNPSVFKFTEGKSFEEADSLKQAYATVKCRIVSKKDENKGSYIGCSATTWAEVYFPINSASWVSNSQPYGTTKAVSLEFTGGYTKAGNDFLKENSGDSNMENTSVEGVKGGVYSTEDWVDDTVNSVTITL